MKANTTYIHTHTSLRQKGTETDRPESQLLVISIPGPCAGVYMNLKGEQEHLEQPIKWDQIELSKIHSQNKQLFFCTTLFGDWCRDDRREGLLVPDKNRQLCVKLSMMDLHSADQLGRPRRIKLKPPPELRGPADSELTPEKAELMSVWLCNQCWGMCKLKAILAAHNTSFPFLTTP